MKIGITSKLFLAVLGASVAVAVAMGVAVRLSFERGFLDYLNEREEQAVRTLGLALAESYAEHGGWDFLRGDPRKWRD